MGKEISMSKYKGKSPFNRKCMLVSVDLQANMKGLEKLFEKYKMKILWF